MLTSEQLSTFHSQLIKAKKDIEARFNQNDHYGLTRGDAHESIGELSSYDNHPGDLGTELYEREKDVALNEHTEIELKNINDALNAIENGTYGKCAQCGKDISLDRLKALPTTIYCKEHSPDQFVSHQRPIEEDVLKPAFGQFEFDEKDAEVFDAEDSWQEVARFGTSETPSDIGEDTVHFNRMYVEAEENINYVEDFENFVGTDIEGKNLTVYSSIEHEEYEDMLDDYGAMSIIGDLPAHEKEPYVEEDH